MKTVNRAGTPETGTDRRGARIAADQAPSFDAKKPGIRSAIQRQVTTA